MITNLKVKNFRCFSEASLDLERLTILVGRNGSGKSTLVDVLRFVRDALQLGLDAAVLKRGGMSAIRRWSAKGRPYDVEIKLTFDLEGATGFYSFVLGSAKRGEYQVKEERCEISKEPLLKEWFSIRSGEWIGSSRDIKHSPTQSTALVLPLVSGVQPFDKLYEFLTKMSFYEIVPNVLREPQKPANPYPLEEDAKNLASVLRELKQEHKTSAGGLEKALARIIGDIEGYQVRQVGGYLVTRLRHAGSEEDGASAPTFELFQESDGTLRVLGILTAYYQSPPRPLITLEEPELTIHPGAMGRLWEEIQTAAERSQILITTHSPDLLDMSLAEQLRVVEKFQGVSQVGPVDTDQKQIIKKRLLSVGELLRGQGLYRAGEE